MTTCWALEYQPSSRRVKPWIDYRSIRKTRLDAWDTAYEKAAAAWVKELDKRRRKGLIKCVKVTIQKVES